MLTASWCPIVIHLARGLWRIENQSGWRVAELCQSDFELVFGHHYQQVDEAPPI